MATSDQECHPHYGKASHLRLIEALRLRDPELAASRASEHILEVPAQLHADGGHDRDVAG